MAKIAARKIAHGIVARLREDITREPAHDDRPPAERVRVPRETDPPPRLVPPVEGMRDPETARVVAGWIFNLTPRMRLRGVRVRLLEVWHG